MRLSGSRDGESVRITPFGILLIALVVVGLLLAGVGPRGAQIPGFLMALLAGVALLGSTGRMSGRRGLMKSVAERREEFGPRPQKHSETPLSKEAEDALWQAERERRQRGGRST